jgi:hypothetical protein
MVCKIPLVDLSYTRRVAHDTAFPYRRRRFRAIVREAINLKRESDRAYEKGKSSQLPYLETLVADLFPSHCTIGSTIGLKRPRS